MKNSDDFLTLLPFWNNLSTDEQSYILSAYSFHSKSSRDFFPFEALSCQGMIYVVSGVIRAYIVSDEGREITLFKLGKGDSCVLSASCVISQIDIDIQMAVEKDCEYILLPSLAFKHITDSNIFARCFMYEKIAEKFQGVMSTMQQVLFTRLDKRLASFLVAQYEKTGKKEIHITHRKLAMELNSAREVIARIIKRFAEEGLIEQKRGYVILADIDGLKSI